MEYPARDVTEILDDWRAGDAGALDRLIPLVYDELRSLAEGYLRRERPDHTLEPTALLHEAFLRLVEKTHPGWEGRAHFFAVAAQLMRRILVDHARERRAAKRGGGAVKVSLEAGPPAAPASAPLDLVDLLFGGQPRRHHEAPDIGLTRGLSFRLDPFSPRSPDQEASPRPPCGASVT